MVLKVVLFQILLQKRCLLISINNEIVLQIIVDEDYFIIMFYHHDVFTFQIDAKLTNFGTKSDIHVQ